MSEAVRGSNLRIKRGGTTKLTPSPLVDLNKFVKDGMEGW